MSKKTPKKSPHVHVWDIPKKYFPRNTKAKEYRRELARMMSTLRYTNEKVQYSASICSFNIGAISHKRGLRPNRAETFRQISAFVYHYENYCFRAYAFREKLLQFLNAMFALNFPERDVKLRFIRISPPVIAAKLVHLLEKFDNKNALGKIIEDRNSLTHKLYYGDKYNEYLQPISSIPSPKNMKKWCTDWKKEVISRSKLTNKCTMVVFDINHELAEKIVKFKTSHTRRASTGKKTRKRS